MANGLLVPLNTPYESPQYQSPFEKSINTFFQQRQIADQQKRQNLMDSANLKEKGLVQDEQGGLGYTPEKQAEIDEGAQARDPSSTRSQFARNLVQKMGGNGLLTGQESYNDINKLTPTLEKFSQAKQHGEDLRFLKGQADQQGKDRRAGDLESKFADDIDPAKGRNGQFGKVLARRQAADQANALYEQNPDGNFNASQAVEFATAAAALVSNGTPQSSHQIMSLVPKSYKGDFNKFLGELTNNPRGLEQQKFIKSLKDTIDREKNLATDQLVGIIKQKSTKHQTLRDMAPDRYDRVLQGALDPYGLSLEDLRNYDYKKKGGGLVKDNGGLVQDNKAAGAKPKTVIQNGVTYNLNPTTGQYE